MASTLNIKDFPSLSAASEADNILFSLADGTPGKLSLGLLKAILQDGVPSVSIRDGNWYIGEENTGVRATGKTPVFRRGATGIEWKYEEEPNESYKILLSYDQLPSFDAGVFESVMRQPFKEVSVTGDAISIDAKKTPYAKVALSGEGSIFNLSIHNAEDGASGKILVFQTGFKQITVGGNIKGTIDLPVNENTIALLSYHVLEDTIYIYSSTVLGDARFPKPKRIDDLQLVYSDTSVCTVQWSAPHANNIYDSATEYDMRYANSPVNADDPKVWGGLKKVTGVPTPAAPGTAQRMTISGLSANKEYYVYLKSVRMNFGVQYVSESSDFVYFKTLGVEDTSKAFRIDLSERNLFPQLRKYNSDVDGTICSIDKMVDEVEKTVFLESGYPDTQRKEFTTFWSQYKYSCDTSPFDITIDLFSPYAIDKMFIYTRGRLNCSLYAMRDEGYPWVKIGGISITFNDWASVDFSSFQCRFLKISFDQQDFGHASTAPRMPEGAEGFPDPENNSTLERIDNILLYGRPVSNRPTGIMPPIRKSTASKTVDQFFCTNGHAYQQGRIHSMCSGERMRMYIHFGHFAALHGTPDAYTRIADMRFNVNQVGWVAGNNGTGKFLEETLRDTYRRFGLKPYLCNTGVFDYCYYDKAYSRHNRPCDNYWYPQAWRPVPRRGVGGLDRYFGVTKDAANYRTYAKLCEALAAKYGKKEVDGSTLFYPETEDTSTGLDLICGIEAENEPDQFWSKWIGYTHAEEYAAVLSAATDGHDASLVDEDGRPLKGVKAGDILSISSGTASINRAYYLSAILNWRNKRKNARIPVDVFSMHMYCSNIGNQGQSSVPVQYGITFEESLRNEVGAELIRMVELRNRLAPDKEVALTEFGWGESGGRETSSKYQCYTQPGRQIGNWTIPDRHRSDVKGAWIVRACLQMMAIGVDFVNYYATECEGNYFDAGQWGSGAGFEMFHWNDCTDLTPGAKATAIRQYEHTYSRGGFATTGLFGQILGNGAYPITRAYWWVATMRTRLKGYVFTGLKFVQEDPRIFIACFKKKGEEKGAYAVYLNDNKNTGVESVEIPVPEGVTSYKHVTVYVPEIPNPENVPANLAYDQKRTGLPTSRKERYENGEWVLANQPYMPGKYSSYSQAPAVYPESPQEGDEVTVLPTLEENPYFPIVGPVAAKNSVHGNKLAANQYEQDREEWESDPNMDESGNVIWTVKGNVALSWRQADAVCDYIDYHPEGIHGRYGDEVVKPVVKGNIVTNVSEFPEFYFFDAAPQTDYYSKVTDFSSRAVNSSSVELWWNNTQADDSGYHIFVSHLPETEYRLLKEVPVDVENRAVIAGLEENTVYYFKIRPVKGDSVGEMSEYTSVRTYSELEAPSGLVEELRTATSIRIAWEYTQEPVADFVHFEIFRASGSGNFVPVGRVEDITVRTYTDTELNVGHNYSYKVRAVGLNGRSAYTEELVTRTLLPNESSPFFKFAMTDKLGTKIQLSFDLPIGTLSSDAATGFTLTEDGVERIITGVSRNEADPRILIINIPQGSLSDFDRKRVLKISYRGGGIVSAYGIPLAAFEEVRVANVIGNFGNLESTYKLNFCSETSPLPADEEWNNIAGNPQSGELSVELKDTYGRTKGVVVSPVHQKPKFQWGSNTDSGHCEIPGIEEPVYKNGWFVPGYGGSASESIIGRLRISGLSAECRYTFKVYGGTKNNGERLLKLKVDGRYSNMLNISGNKEGYLIIEDCKPSTEGVLFLDFVNGREAVGTDYPLVSFMMIEEYTPETSPANQDVYLRSVTVNEAVDGAVSSPTIHLHLNVVGAATAYRISESFDFTGAEWIAMGDEMDVPYEIASGYGAKVIYAQVMNVYGSSNIRPVEVEYCDPYVPLLLKNVYINEDDSLTYKRECHVKVIRDGLPTHYRVGESASLEAEPWIEWPGAEATSIPYTLSEGDGVKTVYAQVKDAVTESAIKADTIHYKRLEYVTGTVTIPLPDGIGSAEEVNVSVAPLKYDKRFAFGYSVDDTSMQTYSVVQMLYSGKWIDDREFCHIGIPRSTGYIPEHPLYYTDGFGTKRYFSISNYVIPLNTRATNSPLPMEVGHSIYNPNLSLDELKYIMDFDGDWMIHNVDETVWDKTNSQSLAKGMIELNDYMEGKGVGRAILSSTPDGNDNYVPAGIACPDVMAILHPRGAGVSQDVYNRDNLEKMFIPRAFMTEMTLDVLKGRIDDVSHKSVRGESAYWGTLGGHRPRGKVGTGDADWIVMREFLKYAHDTYGAGGSDEMWFANDTEIYEYLYLRKHTILTKRVEGGNLVITVEMPKFANFKWMETTLMLDIEASGAESSEEIKGFTYGMKNGKFMMNVNMMDSLAERAERYTSKAETSLSADDIQDALYFIQRLKPTLRAAYMERMRVIMTPPVLQSLASMAVSYQANTTIAYFADGAVTHYMLSDNPDFDGVSWQVASDTPNISCQLSEGENTLYVKLKNDYGESDVKSITVTYERVEVGEKIIVSFGNKWNNVAYEMLPSGEMINFISSAVHSSYSTNVIKDISGNECGRFLKNPSLYAENENPNYYATHTMMDSGITEDTGAYPSKYLFYYACLNTNQPNYRSRMRFEGIAPGTYKVRLLPGSKSTHAPTDAQLASMFYAANGVETNLNFNIVQNNSRFVEINNVVVGVDGMLDIHFWNTIGLQYRPGFNLIEITKV